MAPKCPKDDGPAHRIYAQVTSPYTHRSTTVTLPAVFCGTLRTQVVDGRTVGTFDTPTGKKGSHGLVELALDVFQTERRQSVRLTTRRHAKWKGVAAPKPKAAKKATKTPAAASKARKAPKAKPKAPRAGRAVSATMAAPLAEGSPPEPAPMAAAPAATSAEQAAGA